MPLKLKKNLKLSKYFFQNPIEIRKTKKKKQMKLKLKMEVGENKVRDLWIFILFFVIRQFYYKSIEASLA